MILLVSFVYFTTTLRNYFASDAIYGVGQPELPFVHGALFLFFCSLIRSFSSLSLHSPQFLPPLYNIVDEGVFFFISFSKNSAVICWWCADGWYCQGALFRRYKLKFGSHLFCWKRNKREKNLRIKIWQDNFFQWRQKNCQSLSNQRQSNC